MARPRGTPLWATIGCGCCLLVVLVIGAVVAAGMFGASAFKGYVADMKDPEVRTRRGAEILGAAELPESYTALLFLHIPWLVDVVALSDGEPVVLEDGEAGLRSDLLGRHLFVYFALPGDAMDHDEFERMLRGDSAAEGVKADIDIEIESDRELSRGSFEIGDQKLSYVGHRGTLDLEDGAVEGIYSQVLIECPRDRKNRAAVWFQRGELGGETGEPDPLEVIGTPAEEDTLRRFMGYFNVCAD